MQVVDGSDAATGNQMEVGLLQNLLVEIKRGPLQHAILRYVGTDGVPDAFADIIGDEVDHICLRLLLPPLRGDATVVAVGAENDLLRTIGLQPLQKQIGLLQGDAATGNLPGAVLEGDPYCFVGLDASAKIDLQRGLRGDGVQDMVVDDVLRLCPVEVHQMQVADAVGFKFFRYLQRVLVVDLFCVVIAFGEADTLASDDVDGRDDSHNLRKFSNIRSPTLPDFSG